MYIKDIKSKVAKSLIFLYLCYWFSFSQYTEKIQNLYVGGFLTVLWYLDYLPKIHNILLRIY